MFLPPSGNLIANCPGCWDNGNSWSAKVRIRSSCSKRQRRRDFLVRPPREQPRRVSALFGGGALPRATPLSLANLRFRAVESTRPPDSEPSRDTIRPPRPALAR